MSGLSQTDCGKNRFASTVLPDAEFVSTEKNPSCYFRSHAPKALK